MGMLMHYTLLEQNNVKSAKTKAEKPVEVPVEEKKPEAEPEKKPTGRRKTSK